MNRFSIHFAGAALEIQTCDDRSKRLAESLFQHFHPDQPAAAGLTYRLQEDEQSGDLVLFSGDELDFRASGDGEMAAYLLERAGYHLADRSQGGLALHAAGVSSAGRGLLIPGATRSGKSTLAAWLLHIGLDYLSDEMVFIPTGTSQLEGYPRPVCLKPNSWPVLEGIFDPSPARDHALHTSWADIVPPAMLGKGQVIQAAQLDRLIFPHYQEQSEGLVERLSKAQAGLALMECLVNGRNLPEHGFAEIVRLVQVAPAYRLIYSDFTQIEPIVTDWLSHA